MVGSKDMTENEKNNVEANVFEQSSESLRNGWSKPNKKPKPKYEEDPEL